ncbi:HTH-type transcriptional regulator FrlR [Lentibacillus sp. JNUCC-1]|uniref:GntR family transcriptional regulator n=1 Tax=Lentibacillus sp. JNUCC-1 TaxID=2654513 RepID=UPI0012E77694|nr:GntR family transcriptional regulator [Lentibacillus sp. JNUCC-1]MUV37163.1 HTH-type transcriptional regulator FrlR [Lentibacillus sp. JNUCC-1]
MALDYISSIPLHVQLKEAIEEKVLAGQYTDQIPSERELMDEYYVSRSTVRQSISQLVQEGVLEKRRGKGTFVAIKPINDWLGSLSSTYEIIERMGMKPGAQVIESKILSPGPELQPFVKMAKVYHIARLRYANRIPIGIERHYYPVEIGEQLARFDLKDVSLYTLLETEMGVITSEADQIITSTPLTGDDAALLKLPEHTGVLNAKRTITDMDGKFVEFENAYYRADMYSFHIKLSRKGN